MPLPRSGESQVQYHVRRARELDVIRQPWHDSWRQLAEYVEPTMLRITDRDEKALSRKNIRDSTPTFALRTLQSGMHSGITSPSRPWFRTTTPDPDLRDFGPVKEWIDTVESRMREVIAGSNSYKSFHAGYGHLGLLGQSAAILIEDDHDIIRLMQLLHGQFWLARDETGRCTTLYRKFRWSCQRVVQKFGLTGVSQAVKSAWDQGNYDTRFWIWHAIEPRLSRDGKMIDGKNKPFLSNYWEDATNNASGQATNMLQEGGFDDNPIIAPAWDISGDDNYGYAPGHIILGDAIMLQLEQTRKLEGIDKQVRPPMTGPTSMRNNPNSLLPGSMTYVDDPAGKGYRPAMDVNISLGELREDMGEARERIKQGMYADLFLMLANMEGVQPRNVLEISERKEEKLLALGPVLENIYHDQLGPFIDRTFNIMQKLRMFPPAPKELHDVNLKVEYISTLAQAQKAVATGSIERLFGFAGQIAALNPTVLDKLDCDDAIEVYAEMVGAPATVINSDDVVKQIRQDRAQQQKQMQLAGAAPGIAKAAKDGADAAATTAANTQPGGPADPANNNAAAINPQSAAVAAGAIGNPSANSLLSQLGLG